MIVRFGPITATLTLLALTQAALANSILESIDDAIAVSDYSLALRLLEARIQESPEDVSLLYRRARVQNYLGDHAAALLTLDTLRLQHPQDVDYALTRAQVLAAQDRDIEALDDLRDATTLASDYEDVWRLRYSLLLRQQHDDLQLELDAVQAEAKIRFPNAAWWRKTRDDFGPQWSLLVGAGHESLDNGSPSWGQQFVEVSRTQQSGGNYRLGVARDTRYDESDLTVTVGGDVSFASHWFADFSLGSASSPSFQPDLGYSASIGRALRDGWVAGLRYRRREYETVAVGSIAATVEKYFGDFRVAYVLGQSHLRDAPNALNHSITANWYYDDQMSFGISLNTGEEVEVIGPGQVMRTDVRGISLNGRRQMTDRFGLQWWLGFHDQGDFYRRRFLGLAVSIQL